MPKHKRETDDFDTYSGPQYCDVPWCHNAATDSYYCWEHDKEYARITVSYE